MYFMFLAMIFLHIIDDYCLQGILSKLKQKMWWKENAPQKLYKNDYLMGLFMHSFSWTFMIMLPIAIFLNFQIGLGFLILFSLNLIIHAYVDNLKANLFKINLITDQSIHLMQIIITFLILR